MLTIGYFAYTGFTAPATTPDNINFIFEEAPSQLPVNPELENAGPGELPVDPTSEDVGPSEFLVHPGTEDSEEVEPEVEVRPDTPQRHDAVDAGSALWKGKSQWMQIALLVSCLLILIIDTGQKRRQIKDDTRRGSSEKTRLKFIWWAPSLVVLGALFLVKTDWSVIDFMLLDSGWRLAIVYAIICFGLAYLLMDGDSSYPATGLTLTALGYLLEPTKTGALITAFKIPADAAMFSVADTLTLITLNHLDQALFGLLILSLFAVAAVFVSIDLARDTNQNDPMTFAGITIAIVSGVIIFAAGRWIEPVWSFLLFLLAAFIGQAITVEKFDEALLLGIILGSVLTLAFPLLVI